ncbi:MAG TPA: metallophosphoesterase family protein [Burkholderiales bacterium]|nr:metallophosphoesterase family protein [Burkholderiales bacterium]
MRRIGLISDTHGLLRTEAAAFLRGCERIVHAGDIGDAGVLDLDPAAAGFQVVVSGHSHRPLVELRDRVLYVNPGSAGPRRFSLPIAIAELQVSGATVEARLVELAP